MRRALLLLGCMTAAVLLMTFSLISLNKVSLAAVQGRVDLSTVNLSAAGSHSLNGDWAFYWDQLIDPGHFDADESLLTGYRRVPGLWTDYQDPSLPAAGRATYRLLVNLSAGNDQLAISLPKIYTEYKIWINGKLLAANGLQENAVIKYLSPEVLLIEQHEGPVEIIIQIGNQMHIIAGIGQGIQIGPAEQLLHNRMLSLALDLAVIAVCLFAGFYHLMIFLFRRNRRTYVWFAMICLTVGLRGLLTSQNFLMAIWPAMPFELGSRLMSLLIPAMVLSVLFYLRYLYPKRVPRWFDRVLMLISLVYALSVIVLPVALYLVFFNYYMTVTVMVCLLMIYLSFQSLVSKMQGSILFMLGTVFFVSGALFELLHYFHLIEQGHYLTLGLVTFAVTQTLILALNYSQLDIDRQRLTQRLRVTDLTYLRAQIKPHFIYNALSAISSTISTNPSQAKSLLLDFSDYLRGCFSSEREDGLNTLAKELHTVQAYLSLEKARYRDRLVVVFDLQEDENRLVPIMSIQPLVENAVRHGLMAKLDGGTIQIRTWHADGQTHILVEDDGVGMDYLQIAAAVNPANSGIGLANINKRLTLLYNTVLQIESSPGSGTRIKMVLPSE